MQEKDSCSPLNARVVERGAAQVETCRIGWDRSLHHSRLMQLAQIPWTHPAIEL